MDFSLPLQVAICPWDSTGRPRLYVGDTDWAALLRHLPFIPAEEPTTLIVDVPGVGPSYVARAKPIPIYDPVTGAHLGDYDWAPSPNIQIDVGAKL